MLEQIDHKTPIDWLVTVDLNCSIVEAIKALLHLKKKYVSLKEPTHQYFKILEMLFLYSKSVPMCRSTWTWPKWSLSGPRTEWRESIKAPERVALACIWSGRSSLFLSQENFRSVKLGMKYSFLCQSATYASWWNVPGLWEPRTW